MKIPGKLGGNSPLVGWLNALREAVVAAQITSVNGGQIQRGAGGTQLVIPNGSGGGSKIQVDLCDPATGDVRTYEIFGRDITA